MKSQKKPKKEKIKNKNRDSAELKNRRINGRCPKCNIPIIDTGCFLNEELEKKREKKKVNYFCGLRHGRDLFNCIKCGTQIIKNDFHEYVEPPKCRCGTPFWIERFGGSRHLEELNKRKEFTYYQTNEPRYIEGDKAKKLPLFIKCANCKEKVNIKIKWPVFKIPEYIIRKPAGSCPKCNLPAYFTEYNQETDKYLNDKQKKKQITYVTYNRNEFIQIPKQVSCIKCKTSFLLKPKSRF